MDIQLTDIASWQDWTDEEIVEVLLEHYYTLLTTGEQAVLAVLSDITFDRFSEYHLVDDERMGLILVKFARELKECMDTPAIDFYHAKNILAQESDKG
jgi:hypothetical protein